MRTNIIWSDKIISDCVVPAEEIFQEKKKKIQDNVILVVCLEVSKMSYWK